MTIRQFASTAALIALAAGAVPAAAQTAPAGDTPDLPALLQGLDLGRVTVETGRDGRRSYEGVLPDGTGIEAEFAPDDSLIDIESDDGPIPQALIDTLLPQAVRGSQVLAQFDMIEEIRTGTGRFEVKGEDADGAGMRAAFDDAGNVLRFGRDDDREGRGPRHARGNHQRGGDHRDGGSLGDGPHADGPHADGPGGGMPHGAGMRGGMAHGDGAPGDGPHRDMRGAEARPAPDFDMVAANQRLTGAGYSALGLLHQDGPRLLLDATNPQGEAVTLELDPQGEVMRETAR